MTYEAVTFHYHVERAVRRQKSQGVGICESDWGQPRPLRPELMCGCPLTLLVADKFGHQKAIEVVTTASDDEASDKIALLLDLHENQVMEFRRGFDDVGSQPITVGGDLWRQAGVDLRKVFIDQKLSSTYKTNHLHDFAGELDRFNDDGVPIPGLIPIIKMLEEWDFAAARALRYHHQETLSQHPHLYKWLKEFFGG